MTVKELILKLSQFDENLDVTITDGYEGLCYRGDWDIIRFDAYEYAPSVDIGVGGTRE